MRGWEQWKAQEEGRERFATECGQLLLPIRQWQQAHGVLYPAIIQGAINRLANMAAVWVSDRGYDLVEGPDIADRIQSDWQLLSGFESVLRRKCRKTKPGKSGRRASSQVASTELGIQTIDLPPSTANHFKRVGDIWTITFDGKTVQLKDSKGLRYIALLLRHPGNSLSALELASELRSSSNVRAATVSDEEIGIGSDMNGKIPMTDARALKQIREKLKKLAARRQNAEALGDKAEVMRCDEEVEKIHEYLGSVQRAGGGSREFSSAAEKARKAVSKSIRIALQNLEREHPLLARHLLNSIKRGRNLSYTPDDETPWDL